MSSRVRKFSFLLISPMLSAALLAGIIAENRRYLQPEDFEPYHVLAKAAIESLPKTAGDFVATDNDEVPREAQILLKPNKILSRRYKDSSVAALLRPRSADLLIVQCKLASDMVGHFPPICYPSHGWENTSDQSPAAAAQSASGFIPWLQSLVGSDKSTRGLPRDWIVADQRIPGMEYQFRQTKDGQTQITTVYNFIVVPGRGIVRDIKGVEQAAEDYQQRYYGAAQFQVVFQSSSTDQMTRQERDEIFNTLMEPAVPVIRQLDTTLKSLKSGA